VWYDRYASAFLEAQKITLCLHFIADFKDGGSDGNTSQKTAILKSEFYANLMYLDMHMLLFLPKYLVRLRLLFILVISFIPLSPSLLQLIQLTVLFKYVNTRREIAIGCRFDCRGVGVRAPVGTRYFSSPRNQDRFWGSPSLLSIGSGVLSPVVKLQGRKADHSPPSSAEVNAGTSPYALIT
jgi:hypothetical protein